jgi:predicted DNA-binding protein
VTKRPPANNHRLGTIKVPTEWAEHLDQLSRDEGRSINELVREALRAYLKRRKLPV